MADHKKELKDTIEKAFKEPFTASQLWALTRLAKYVRLRARNNNAFNNLFNSLFDNATFRQVTKTKKDGSTYPGLSIRVNDQEISEEEEE
jgi:hypothetical protein